MSAENSLLTELRRRNIFRVVTVYAVASWVILQLCDIVLPAIEIEESAIRYVILALIAGLPVVVAFAWFFEITPDGLRPTRQVDRTESISDKTARRIDRVIIGLLSVALVFFMSQYFLAPGTDAGSDSTPTADTASMVADDVPSPTEEESEADDRPSIAVLPLVNMSSDVENEHFSDGLTEELLNVLAQNQELRVAGRTSSFFYKGRNENLKDIGEALDVAHILEGSVRKSGNLVRVTVQLINASDGFHIWSKTYDREMKDIFAIQDEISQAVASAMEVTLLDSTAAPDSRLTSNTEAYNLYLQARELLYERSLESVRESIRMFEEVIRMDPGFAPPYVGLAEANMVLETNFRMITEVEAAENARNALASAARLGYETAEYWATLGLYHQHMIDFDRSHYDEAARAYEKALEMNKNLVMPYIWYSSMLTEESEGPNDVGGAEMFATSRHLIEEALRLDPLNRVANGNYQIELADRGELERAETNLKRLIRIDSEYDQYRSLLGRLYFTTGRFVESAEQVVSLDRSLPIAQFQTLRLLQGINREAAASRLIESMDDTGPSAERILEAHFAHTATLTEVIGKAQLILLQPDPEERGGPFATRLIREGELALARRLLEHMHPEYLDETPRFSMIEGHVLEYAEVLYLQGERERPADFARRRLEQNRYLPRIAIRGRGVDNALCYILLDRREEAVIEVEAAFADGWRAFYAERLHERPIYGEIRNDVRIVNVQRKIDAELAPVQPRILSLLEEEGFLPPVPETRSI